MKEHIPLAKKYRPQTFKELIGQETIVRILQNAINGNKLAHAFIFVGVRGVGKTTIARILAKGVNCNAEENRPCGVCESCVAVRESNHLDVYEIDAASKTGVDDVRDIIESVRYKPSMGRVKVYILDEVHMLSINAFNALLKTLEEPPPHVIFIFSTTEIHKVPTTIISRCQRFDLFRVSCEHLIAHFINILHQENIMFEQEALKMIARVSDGSVRDGLSILDQAIILSAGEKIISKDVENMLGLVDNLRVVNLIDALLEKNVQLVLDILDNLLVKRGCDPNFLLHSLNVLIIDLAKADFVPDFFEKSFFSSEMKFFFNKWKGCYHFRQLSRIAQIFEKGMADLRYAYFPYELIYMTIMRVIYAMDLPFPDEPITIIHNNKCTMQESVQSSGSSGNQLSDEEKVKKVTRNNQLISEENVQSSGSSGNQLSDEEKVKKVTRNNHISSWMMNFLSASSSQDILNLLIELAIFSNEKKLISFLKNEAKVLEWQKGILVFAKSDLLTDDFLQSIRNMLENNKMINYTGWKISYKLEEETIDFDHNSNSDKILNNLISGSSFMQELQKYLPNSEIISVEDIKKKYA